jgi:hypothetical protein
MPEILATWEAEMGKFEVRGQPEQRVQKDLIFTITIRKWTGGMAQAVEILFYELKVLSSNLSPVKKESTKALEVNINDF